MKYPLQSSKGGLRWKEQGCSGGHNEGVGQVEGQDAVKFRVDGGGGTLEVS
jgi:hypothetical protein